MKISALKVPRVIGLHYHCHFSVSWITRPRSINECAMMDGFVDYVCRSIHLSPCIARCARFTFAAADKRVWISSTYPGQLCGTCTLLTRVIIIRSTHTGPIIEMYRLDVSRIMIFDWISVTNRHVSVILRLNDPLQPWHFTSQMRKSWRFNWNF